MEGAVSVEIFNSKLLAGSFEVKTDNDDAFLLIYNDINYPINNFLINANIIEEQVKIEKLLISNTNDKIEIEGIIEDSFKNVNAKLNINITKLDISIFQILFIEIQMISFQTPIKFLVYKVVNWKILNLDYCITKKF